MLRRARKEGERYLNPVDTSAGGFWLGMKVMGLYLTNRAERAPRVAPGPFRTDSGVYAAAPASGLRVTWMGHSSTLLEIDGVRVLIDPVWDERASPVQWFGPKRFFATPLLLEELPPIDVVLVSHDHFDHLGAGTVRQLATLPATADARWVTSLGVGTLLRGFGLGVAITEMDWMDEVVIGGVRITALPARHFSGRSLLNRFETLWSSFALRGPEHSVYYGADSGWWEGFAAIGAAYGPFDLTMLEIGAFDELWKDIHLGPDRAADAFAALGGKGLLMPVHWGLFDLALHAWRQPIERLVEVAGEQGIGLWTPEPGRPTEVVPDESLISRWWAPGLESAEGG